MTKLSDTQTILLSTASQREDGSLYPLPASLRPGGGTSKALTALIGKGLVEEREATATDAVARADGDMRFGLFITAAGLAAIGAGDGMNDTDATTADDAAPTTAKSGSKISGVLALLRRPDGASIAELIEQTGWLPHTTRAALTGLKKKGHHIERSKRGDVTCYRVLAA